jgi:L-ribulose-5-phosphate 4-epimerase
MPLVKISDLILQLNSAFDQMTANQFDINCICCGFCFEHHSSRCARHLTQEELDAGYELNTGNTIVECFKTRNIDPVAVPAVICHSHGPFTWGKDAADAVYHAVVLEEVSKMAIFTRQVNATAAPAPQRIQDKHYMRKHGPNAYYGQGKK